MNRYKTVHSLKLPLPHTIPLPPLQSRARARTGRSPAPTRHATPCLHTRTSPAPRLATRRHASRRLASPAYALPSAAARWFWLHGK
eukprot:scaffold88344_cov51-Phaeocystis_antarctica.AAC.3